MLCPKKIDLTLAFLQDPGRHTVKNQLIEMQGMNNDESTDDGIVRNLGHVVCLVKNSRGKLVEQGSDEDDKQPAEQETDIRMERDSDEDDPKKRKADIRKCWYYLDNGLSLEAWNLLYGSIASNPYIDQESTKDFLSVLKKMDSSLDSKSSNGDYRFKLESQQLMRVLAVLEQAVHEHCMVNIMYGEYVLEKSSRGQYQPSLQVRPSYASGKPQKWRMIKPIALSWANGYYYLFAGGEDRVISFRVDRILKAVLPVEKELPDGKVIYKKFVPTKKQLRFNAAQEREHSPNMYGGDPEKQLSITLRALNVDGPGGSGWLNAIVDTFGAYHVQYSEPQYNANNRLAEFSFRVTANRVGLKMFILEHLDIIRIPNCPENDTEKVNTFRKELQKIVASAANNL